jgi:hypothetical protein
MIPPFSISLIRQKPLHKAYLSTVIILSHCYATTHKSRYCNRDDTESNYGEQILRADTEQLVRADTERRYREQIQREDTESIY